jgi:pre-mRNA-splicing factor SPF27
VPFAQDNELLKAELARVEARQTLNVLDTIRYTLPDPTEPNRSEADWEHALSNARSQLEHQLSRYALSC